MLPFPSPIVMQQQRSPWESYLPQFLGMMLMNRIRHKQDMEIYDRKLKAADIARQYEQDEYDRRAAAEEEGEKRKETRSEKRDLRSKGFRQFDWPEKGQVWEEPASGKPFTLQEGMYRQGPEGGQYHRPYTPSEQRSLRESANRPRELDIIGSKLGIDTTGRTPITKEDAAKLLNEITKIKKERQANAMLQLLEMFMGGKMAMDNDINALTNQYNQLKNMSGTP